MLKSLADCSLRNLVESYAADALAALLLTLLLFLFALPVIAEFFSQVSGDGLAFAVRVRRQIDMIRGQGQLLQLGQDLFFTRNDDVFSLEIIVGIDTKSALRQILHVAERCFDRVALAQILLNGLRLGWRLDDN